MGDAIVRFFERLNLPQELVVFLISMFPVIELRGGLPVASVMGMPWYIALPICVVGNMLPVPFIVIFIRRIFVYLRRFKPFERLIEKLENKAHTKGDTMKDKHMIGKLIGLYIFVAIPLPGTGAWTGSLIAAFLDIRLRYAFPAILLGVLTAGLIMLVLSYFIPNLFGLAV